MNPETRQEIEHAITRYERELQEVQESVDRAVRQLANAEDRRAQLQSRITKLKRDLPAPPKDVVTLASPFAGN